MADKTKGEYPACRELCPTQRTICELLSSCENCELRTKKAKDVKWFSHFKE
jgi:hypothetical protein